MPVLVTPRNLVDMVGKQSLLLITDYDGTLVPIASTPGEAVPPGEVVMLLKDLCRVNDVQAAVVSGRPLQWLEEYLPVEALYLAGSHGAQIRQPGGKKVQLVNGAGTRKYLQPLARHAQKLIRGRRGFLLEDKGISIALHYRQAAPEEAAVVLRRFRSLVVNILPCTYEIMQGKKVWEVRPGHLHKGQAAEWLLNLFPQRTVLYFGDDITDEDGFRVIQGRGMGILVGERDRSSLARLRLAGPEQVRDFLRLLIDQFTGEPGAYG